MAASVDRLLDRILGSLLPPRCVLCSGSGQRPCLDLCADCQGELPAVESACLRCGAGIGNAVDGRLQFPRRIVRPVASDLARSTPQHLQRKSALWAQLTCLISMGSSWAAGS